MLCQQRAALEMTAFAAFVCDGNGMALRAANDNWRGPVAIGNEWLRLAAVDRPQRDDQIATEKRRQRESGFLWSLVGKAAHFLTFRIFCARKNNPAL